jgi:2',3'-cyclic-nucleotide 2'-phosphodiesterase (5'-nucleotidase family)
MGGLSRRATIIEKYRKKDSQLLVVEAGNFAAKTSKVSEGSIAQQRRKAQLQMEAFNLSKTDIIGVGEKDLALGVDWFFAQANAYQLPLVGSNLECGVPNLSKRKEVLVDGLQIHFYSLMNEKLKIDGCSVLSLSEALDNRFEAKDTINVLLSQLPKNQLNDVISKFQFDIVIDAKMGKNIRIPESLDLDTILLATGSKGKFVGYAQMLVDDTGKGFRHEESKESISLDIQRTQRRIDKLDIENPSKSIERKLQFYKAELEKNNERMQQLENAPQTNKMENELIPLGSKVEDWAGLNEPIQEAMDDITLIVTGKNKK